MDRTTQILSEVAQGKRWFITNEVSVAVSEGLYVKSKVEDLERQLSNKTKEYTDKLKKCNTDINAIRAKADKLKGEFDALVKGCADLEAKLREAEITVSSYRGELQKTKSALQETHNKIAVIDAAKSGALAEANKLQERLDVAEKALDKFAISKPEIMALADRLKAITEEMG